MATILDLFRGRGLTKPAVVSPSGTEFYDNPQEQAQGIVATQQAPATTMDSAPIPYQDASGQANNENPDVPVQSGEVDAKAVTPTFNQVAKDRYGNVRQGNNQGLSKLGLFWKVISGGVQGGLDAIEGGALDAPRNGESNFGKGLGAARTMPLIRASRVQQQQRGQLENDMLQGQSQPIDTPLGPMPMWKAKQLAEVQKTQAEITNKNADTEYKKKHGEYFEKDKLPTLQQLHAQATQKAIDEGRDPNQDPQVQQYADQITALQRQPQEKEPTNSFQAYQSAFRKKYGRDMNPEEITAYDRKHALSTHITVNTPKEIDSSFYSKTGDDALAALRKQNPQLANNVDMVRKYELDPKQLSNRSGVRDQIFAAAKQVDPNFKPANYADIFKTRQSFVGNGENAKNLGALNTAIGHMGMLEDARKALNNGDVRLFAKIGNELGIQFGSDVATNYNAVAEAVAQEVSKTLHGGVPNEGDVASMRKSFDYNATGDQQRGGMQKFLGLLDSRLAALKQGYVNGTHGLQPDFEFLYPESKQVLDRVGVKMHGSDTSGAGEWKVVDGIRVRAR
jgi:hypothetical protein